MVQGPARVFLALQQGDGESRCSWKTIQAAGLLGATRWQPHQACAPGCRGAWAGMQGPQKSARRGVRSGHEQTRGFAQSDSGRLSLKRGRRRGWVWELCGAQTRKEEVRGPCRVKARETHAGEEGAAAKRIPGTRQSRAPAQNGPQHGAAGVRVQTRGPRPPCNRPAAFLSLGSQARGSWRTSLPFRDWKLIYLSKFYI